MIDGGKPFNFPSEKMGETLKRWMKVYICALIVSSVVYLSYSATHRWGYRYPLASTHAAGSSAAAATNVSHVVFGIGGSARTWPRRRGYSELWWRPGETRGHVWLDEEPPPGTWPDACPPYRVSAADASRFGARAAASRMAAIVAEAYAAAGPEGARWFVMGDDDTVFFVENLVAVLGRYDHREMYYIGAASESVEQDVMHSYGMAFGGGGFAVSYPAAAELARVIGGCLERYASFYGSDQRIQACLSELGVPLTREPGFHQVDLKGDVYGMLAAHPIAPLVSLHHLDYVKPISPTGSNRIDSVRSLVDASRFDPARVLQQSFCYLREPGLNWSVSVSWGYTAQLYPWVLPPRQLEVPLQTFQTWRSVSDGPFTFNSRPLAGPDRPCERPIFFFLDRIHEGTAAGATVTEYSRHEVEKEKACERLGYAAAASVERVRVSAPKMDPTVWKRAPRRQCCEAHRDGSMSIEIAVRDCYVGEITSPP